MGIVIDPAIKLLPEDQNVFVLHPGENKRFYKDFAELGAVFLDFPALVLESEPTEDDEDLWTKLRMSRAVATWHRSGKKEGKPNPPTSPLRLSLTCCG